MLDLFKNYCIIPQTFGRRVDFRSAVNFSGGSCLTYQKRSLVYPGILQPFHSVFKQYKILLVLLEFK